MNELDQHSIQMYLFYEEKHLPFNLIFWYFIASDYSLLALVCSLELLNETKVYTRRLRFFILCQINSANSGLFDNSVDV
jgi:hypothetical protein